MNFKLLSISLCLLVSVINCQNVSLDSTSIVMVQVMVRHGIRTILQAYPTYDLSDMYYQKLGGFGVLSPKGMKQMYDFGIYLADYYSGSLNSTYDQSRVYVRSTDYDRTLQSMSSVLAGLFKPNADQKWSDTLNWLPIPVHTNDRKIDPVLHASASCPRYDYLRQYWRNSSEYLSKQEENKIFLSNMSNLSGINPLGYYYMWQIADNALVDLEHERPLEKWVQENYDQIMIANDYTFYIDFVTVEMGKLISGSLLNDIISNMENRINNKTSYELFMYGVHDNYVSGMQKLLNTSTEFKQPPFGSGFVFELRKDANDTYYVRVLWKNDTSPNPVNLTPVVVYSCEELCELKKFTSLMADKRNFNYSVDCFVSNPTTTPMALTTTSGTKKQFNYQSLLISSVISMLLVVVLTTQSNFS